MSAIAKYFDGLPAEQVRALGYDTKAQAVEDMKELDALLEARAKERAA